jgi:hypothetical protein
MKTITLSLLAVTALLTFSSCTTVVETPVTRTTTTEETTVERPHSTTTETHVRSY